MSKQMTVSDQPTPTPAPVLRLIQLPYSPARWAILQAAFPLTEEEWTRMTAVLDAMKPSLVMVEENQL